MNSTLLVTGSGSRYDLDGGTLIDGGELMPNLDEHAEDALGMLRWDLRISPHDDRNRVILAWCQSVPMDERVIHRILP